MFAKTCSLFVLATLALIPTAFSTILFSDDFESNSMARWTTTVANPLETSNLQNIEPITGSISAYMNTSIDRMHHNLIDDNAGSEIFGHSTFTSWIYDEGGPATRIFNEVRGYTGAGLPNGDTIPDGSLSQLLAIGKYNTVTLVGEVYDGTKYQGRLTFGSAAGWFNLNDPGAPSRSVGWHKFDIERLPDETTINFYVDNFLARTLTFASIVSWDTLILGPGLGSVVGDAWIDGMTVSLGPPIPEPSSAVSVALAAAVGGLCRRRR